MTWFTIWNSTKIWSFTRTTLYQHISTGYIESWNKINRHHLIHPSTTEVTNYWFLLKQNSQKGIQDQSKHLRWSFLQKQLMAKGWLFFTLHPRCLYSSKYSGLNNWKTFIYYVVYLVFGQTVFYVKPTRC